MRQKIGDSYLGDFAQEYRKNLKSNKLYIQKEIEYNRDYISFIKEIVSFIFSILLFPVMILFVVAMPLMVMIFSIPKTSRSAKYEVKQLVSDGIDKPKEMSRNIALGFVKIIGFIIFLIVFGPIIGEVACSFGEHGACRY